LNNIKPENITNIFDTVVNCDTKISRADIAAEANLSIMTVGKIIDAFITNGILLQSKEIKGSAGRKAGLVMLNPEHTAFVIDLTSYNFCFTVIDFCLKPDEKIIYPYNRDYSYQQNLIIFFKNIKMYFDNKFNAESKYYGVGVIVPGRYNAAADNVVNNYIPELEIIGIKSIIENITGYDITFIDSDIEAAARSIVNKKYNQNIVHVNINKQNQLKSSMIFGGKVLQNSLYNTGNIGNIYVGNNVTMQAVLKERKKFDDCIPEICHVLHSIINIMTPDIFVIECDLCKISSGIKNKIFECLINEYKLQKNLLPEIVISCEPVQHSHRGIAIKLRDMWFEKLL